LLEKEPEKIPLFAQTMRHWQQDKDFVGVRGAEALAKLPEAERQEWQNLWAEIEGLRQRAASRRTGGPSRQGAQDLTETADGSLLYDAACVFALASASAQTSAPPTPGEVRRACRRTLAASHRQRLEGRYPSKTIPISTLCAVEMISRN
jgi:hypothetical protein